MSIIIGGKRDLAYRGIQIQHALSQTLKNADVVERGRAAVSRLACWAAQFETIPVINNRKVVAYINGAYLAKLIKKTTHTGSVIHFEKVVRGRNMGAKKLKRQLGIHIGFIKKLEAE